MGSRFKHAVHGLASGYAAMACNVLYTLGSVPLALHYLSDKEFGYRFKGKFTKVIGMIVNLKALEH